MDGINLDGIFNENKICKRYEKVESDNDEILAFYYREYCDDIITFEEFSKIRFISSIIKKDRK